VGSQRGARTNVANRVVTMIAGAALLVNVFVPLAYGQNAKAEKPVGHALLIKPAGQQAYLLVHDCTIGTQCRVVPPEGHVAVAEEFLFFSIFGTGVDPGTSHQVLLRIGNVEIPGALNALIPSGQDLQRYNFIVDLERNKRVPPATPGNITVWVDGIMITPGAAVDH
jgi:hypothetical protein